MTMSWQTPTFFEIAMSAEIGGYQSDGGGAGGAGPPVPAAARDEGPPPPYASIGGVSSIDRSSSRQSR
jgi:hypothetical protein